MIKTPTLKITVLGSGTSTGVPCIGCDCPICASDSHRNKRLRSSLFIETSQGNLLIDTSTDLRRQALAYRVRRIDAVLYTHAHADHVHGIDELRSFSYMQKGRIPCYGNPQTIAAIKRMFFYIFDPDTQVGGGIPRLDMHPVEEAFLWRDIEIRPIPVIHGKLLIHGYRIHRMAYITDCSEFPESSLPLLEGLDLLFINALRPSPHPTHFSMEQALELIHAAQPRRAIITHLGHQIDYHADYGFPGNVELAYDGMQIELSA